MSIQNSAPELHLIVSYHFHLVLICKVAVNVFFSFVRDWDIASAELGNPILE